MWLFTSVASASTITVSPAGPADYPTIEAAVDAAASGDTIRVEPGTYSERLVIRGKDLTLESTQGAAVTTIRDGWENSLILVDGGDVVIKGFDVTSSTIRHCVRVRVGSVELHEMVIHDCDAYDGLGGGLRTDSGTRASVFDSEFRNNRAHWTIGARAPQIYSRGEYLEVRNTKFLGGFSEGDCGGVMVMGGDNILVGNWFEGNVATDDGGAFYADGRPTVFPDGTEADGVQTLVLTDNTFVANEAGDDGGAVFLIAMPGYTIDRNLMCNNHAVYRGGGIYVDGAPGPGNLRFNVVQENVAGDDGGGMFVNEGSPTLENNDWLANQSGNEGGGLAVKNGALVLRNDLVAYTVRGDGLRMLGETPTRSHKYAAWWDNTAADVGTGLIGSTDLAVDPALRNVSFDGDCTNDDWAPTASSPLIDAGDPARTDADGSRSDIGAVALGAATPGADPTLDPPTSYTPGAADSGLATEAPSGCACDATAGSTSPFALLMLVAVGRRRAAMTTQVRPCERVSV
ncbi:MAG: hypothetical protein ABMB14_12545 [Myxococcota bacterium]